MYENIEHFEEHLRGKKPLYVMGFGELISARINLEKILKSALRDPGWYDPGGNPIADQNQQFLEAYRRVLQEFEAEFDRRERTYLEKK